MMVLTKYHRASGAIIGLRVVSDDTDPTGTAEVGLLAGAGDETTKYVANDEFLDRTEVTGITVDKTRIAADGVDVATISGLPSPCWLRVNGAFVQASGSHTLSSTAPIIFTVQLVGAHRGPTITVRTGDDSELALDADPRWQALRTATPAQINTWLTSNVTTIAQARNVLRVLLLGMRKLLKE